MPNEIIETNDIIKNIKILLFNIAKKNIFDLLIIDLIIIFKNN